MKKILFFIVFTFCSLYVVRAQEVTEKNVPTAVLTSFKSKFPEVAQVKWKKNKSGKFEADFKLNDKKAEAKFAEDGKWLSSEQRVENNQLPAKAADYIKKNFASYEIDKVKLKEESDGNKKEYEVDLKKEPNEIELDFDADGNFIKKTNKSAGKSKKS